MLSPRSNEAMKSEGNPAPHWSVWVSGCVMSVGDSHDSCHAVILEVRASQVQLLASV